MRRETLMKLLLVTLAIALCIGGGYWYKTHTTAAHGLSEVAHVVRVNDGDTLIVMKEGEGKEEKIRLCGIDAPEKGQSLGKQSRDNLERLVRAADGEVIVQPVDRDRYGRVVAEVFIGTRNPDEEKFLNAEQITAGIAYSYPRYVGKCPNATSISTAEKSAMSQRVGVFGRRDQRLWDYGQIGLRETGNL